MCITLFPVWPIIVKKGIFYLSLFLLILILGFFIIRLVVFIVLRIFGIEFWILPKILEDDDSLWGSFSPII